MGEENNAVAAVGDYTMDHCRNTPKDLTGEESPEDKGEEVKDQETRRMIADIAIQHMD